MDAGSTTTKAVLFREGKMVDSAISSTSGDISSVAELILKQMGIREIYRRGALGAAVTTGSGRKVLKRTLSRKSLSCLKASSFSKKT